MRKFHFRNLLGTVYHSGNVIFSQDGFNLFSPVGNKVSIFDLKNGANETLPVESRYNLTCLALSPNERLLVTVNEEGEVSVISMFSACLLHSHRLNGTVRDIQFSPDGRLVAFAKGNGAFVFQCPDAHMKTYTPFRLTKVFQGCSAEATCLTWSSDSRILAIGSADGITRLIAGAMKLENVGLYTLGSHGDSIVSVQFRLMHSLDLLTVSRNGRLCLWQSSLQMKEVREAAVKEEERPAAEAEEAKKKMIFYTRKARHFLCDAIVDGDGKRVVGATLSAADYCPQMRLLVTGYSTGAFFIHEVSDGGVSLIHSLALSSNAGISALRLSPDTGEWIAIGCADTGSLAVWEWASETFILKQTESEFNVFTCVVFSPDGCKMATGSETGRVKLWNASEGFCFQTFREHSAAVRGVCFGGNEGNTLVSASLDGSVRAFDVVRYRNFRTFTSPTPVQFSCVTLDLAGELVCAGAEDTFDAYLWSLKTGSLLEVLSGHEAPISCVAFSPSPVTASKLLTGSWDKTLRLWEPATTATSEQTVTLLSEVLAVVWRPDARQVAVSTLDGKITLFDPTSDMQESASIEGRRDLGVGMSETDLVTKEKIQEGKAFKTLTYSADGQSILAGGDGKNICLYSVQEGLLIDRFQVSQNYSLRGMLDFVAKRMRIRKPDIDERENDLAGGVEKRVVLPGSRLRDMTSRTQRAEVRVTCVAFSPTGRLWCGSTSEGLLLYSADARTTAFNPLHLHENITPGSIRSLFRRGDYGTALHFAFRLNEQDLIREVLDRIPPGEISLMASGFPRPLVPKLLSTCASLLESSPHVELYLMWIQAVLSAHALELKTGRIGEIQAMTHVLQKALVRKREQLAALSDHNKYMIRYLLSFKDRPTGEDGIKQDELAPVPLFESTLSDED